MHAKSGNRVLAAAGLPLARAGFAGHVAGTSVGNMALGENSHQVPAAVGG
jgi:hypothetical protein